jgi:hypothetical protein
VVKHNERDCEASKRLNISAKPCRHGRLAGGLLGAQLPTCGFASLRFSIRFFFFRAL